MTFTATYVDIRNSKVIDVVQDSRHYNPIVDVFDPWANASEVKKEFDIDLISEVSKLKESYNAVVLTVAHNEFLDFDINKHGGDPCVVFDVKAFLDRDGIDGRL